MDKSREDDPSISSSRVSIWKSAREDRPPLVSIPQRLLSAKWIAFMHFRSCSNWNSPRRSYHLELDRDCDYHVTKSGRKIYPNQNCWVNSYFYMTYWKLKIEIWLWFFFRIVFIFNERRGSKIAIWTFLKSLGTQQCTRTCFGFVEACAKCGKAAENSSLVFSHSWLCRILKSGFGVS